MKFIFVHPGWEGSASDSRVLRDVLNKLTGLKVPTGCYYLIDVGYTNGEGFLTPYKGTRYHLSEWRDGCAPQNMKEYFNMKYTSARNVIERCFGLLKMRWKFYITHKDVEGWRDKSFSLYERLVNIFVKDRATGQWADTPQQMLDEVNQETMQFDDNDIDMDVVSKDKNDNFVIKWSIRPINNTVRQTLSDNDM
ncbi:hypothetical protein Ddye_009436 [Dipteronia dyeriana]|uniref:DDE Tnp4 domain-containing protein n=1 Tax=Dipteronia dyeriana TaxID=168575 RepID=A0AAD9XBJ1_9ROSI|nr:hypothetical protein Ddye_009436 [Dipteronia dyeriana]